MIVPSIVIGLQLVGLNSKSGRSTVTSICLSCTGTPLTNVGNGSLVIVTAAVLRVDVDLRAHIDVAEVERAGDRRRDDREPERRALIAGRQKDLAAGSVYGSAPRPRACGRVRRSGLPGRTPIPGPPGVPGTA